MFVNYSALACSSYYPIENALLAFVMPTQTGFFVFSYYLIENTVLVFVNHSAYIWRHWFLCFQLLPEVKRTYCVCELQRVYITTPVSVFSVNSLINNTNKSMKYYHCRIVSR